MDSPIFGSVHFRIEAGIEVGRLGRNQMARLKDRPAEPPCGRKLGPVAPRSHDMRREYKVLSKLADVFPPAPRAHHLCEDESVMGAIFVVMDRCHGTVVRYGLTSDMLDVPDVGRRLSQTLIDSMADFHDVDYEALGLSDLGRPQGFVERQVHGWKGRWDAAKEKDLPRFEEVYQWLVANMPASKATSLVHNDLGTLLGYWVQQGDPPERGATASMTEREGFLTRAELSERYAKRRGIDVASIAWYEAFAIWKTAVVIQQIYIRWVRGQTKDARFQGMGLRVPALVEFSAQAAGI